MYYTGSVLILLLAGGLFRWIIVGQAYDNVAAALIILPISITADLLAYRRRQRRKVLASERSTPQLSQKLD